MTRQPQSLEEAKQIIGEERAKLRNAVSRLAGSRWLAAILATFVIGFGTHLAYAPERLPPISGLSMAQIGLPSDLDFGIVGEKAQDAAGAARDNDLRGRAASYLADNPERVRQINAIGFGLALVLLLINMTIMTRRRAVTPG